MVDSACTPTLTQSYLVNGRNDRYLLQFSTNPNPTFTLYTNDSSLVNTYEITLKASSINTLFTA